MADDRQGPEGEGEGRGEERSGTPAPPPRSPAEAGSTPEVSVSQPRGWQPSQPVWPTAPNAWPPELVAWLAAQPGAWAYPHTTAPSAWAPGYVPWGYVSAPPVAPVLEPPGRFHPVWHRSLLSLKGRASPRLYLLSLVVGVPGLAGLLLLWIGLRSGISFKGTPIPAAILIELASVVAAVGLLGAALAQAHQRRADGWKDYTGPAPVLAGGALLALATSLYLPLEFIQSETGLNPGVGVATLIQVLLYLAAYVGVVHFLAVRTGALTWRDIVRPQRLAPSQDAWTAGPVAPNLVDAWGRQVRSWRSRVTGGSIGDILWALALLLPLFFVTAFLSALLSVALGLRSSDITSPITTTVTDLDRWITILAVAVLVPIGEEIFYRGLAANAWGRSLSRDSAILRSALFFAAVHIINVTSTDASLSIKSAVFNMAVRVPVAIALTWLYMRRRSLIASATLHGTYNGLIVMIGILASY